MRVWTLIVSFSKVTINRERCGFHCGSGEDRELPLLFIIVFGNFLSFSAEETQEVSFSVRNRSVLDPHARSPVPNTP